jgi:hypothetical protein
MFADFDFRTHLESQTSLEKCREEVNMTRRFNVRNEGAESLFHMDSSLDTVYRPPCYQETGTYNGEALVR